jgi:hypothetical protein
MKIIVVDVNCQGAIGGEMAANRAQARKLVDDRQHELERMARNDHQVEPPAKLEGPHIRFHPAYVAMGAALAPGDFQHVSRLIQTEDVKALASKLETHPTGATTHLKETRRRKGKPLIERDLPGPVPNGVVVQLGRQMIRVHGSWNLLR